MAKATNSLPQPISASAVHVLARIAARKAVQEQLRSEGVRVSLVKPAELSAKAQVYLSQHPEVYLDALKQALHMGLIKPLAMFRNLDGAIYWGELEQGIYELVRSKYTPVSRTEDAKVGVEKTQESRAGKG
jgi:hypothetical protein